jgi:GNAT superfamily N-acetyltransferase
MSFKRARKARPADDILRNWTVWSNRHTREQPEDDNSDSVSEQVGIVWPEPGPDLVAPYLVVVSVNGSADVTSHNLRLFVCIRDGFHYDGDHLWASTSPQSPRHMQIHDLLVRDPRNRNAGRGSVLVAALESHSRRHGCSWIAGGISGVDDMPRIEQFYRDRGYSVVKGIPNAPFEWQVLKEVTPTGHWSSPS